MSTFNPTQLCWLYPVGIIVAAFVSCWLELRPARMLVVSVFWPLSALWTVGFAVYVFWLVTHLEDEDFE